MYRKAGYKKRFSVTLLITVLIAAVCPALSETSELNGIDKTAELVWGKQVSGKNVIHYSFFRGNEWSKSIRVSRENQDSLVPTLSSDNKGRTFVAWTVVTNKNSFLEYVILKDNVIENRPERIETGMDTNMGAYLAIDNEGVPWIVWVGNNGSTSDIFFSYRQNNKWHSPQRLHEENKVPDLFPELIAGLEGSVIVKWKSFDPDGTIITRKKVLKQKKQIISGSQEIQSVNVTSSNPLKCINTFPVEKVYLDRAVLLSRCDNNALPAQIRFLGKRLRK